MADKLEKEAFVSGLSGTSIWEVYGVLFTSCLGLIIRHMGILCSEKIAEQHKGSFVFAVLWEFLTIFLPTLLCFTVLSDHVYLITILLLTVIISVLLAKFTKGDFPPLFPLLNSIRYPDKAPAISAARTWTNICTAVAILAVDFQIFPRRFAKAETYGAGLMDVGVGCYILCHGCISTYARYSVPLTAKSYLKSLSHCLRKVLPYVVIGLLRIASVRAADYQQHTSEYGVHWNFFFTIATVKLLSDILAPVFIVLPTSLPYALFGTLLIFVYQLSLTKFGVMEYIIYGPNRDFSRKDLFSANREGMCSVVGYLALYYFGIEAGRAIHSAKRRCIHEHLKVVTTLAFSCLLCICITMVTERTIDGISRRAANISYCFWSLSVGKIIILVMFVSDYICLLLRETTKSPVAFSPFFVLPSHKATHVGIVSAIDYNQFTFFLLANLLTGLVNFMSDTIHAGPMASMFIMTFYLILLTTSAMALRKFNIKLI